MSKLGTGAPHLTAAGDLEANAASFGANCARPTSTRRGSSYRVRSRRGASASVEPYDTGVKR